MTNQFIKDLIVVANNGESCLRDNCPFKQKTLSCTFFAEIQQCTSIPSAYFTCTELAKLVIKDLI